MNRRSVLAAVAVASVLFSQLAFSKLETPAATRLSRQLASTGVPSELVRKKLVRIIVPNLQFRGATAGEALQFLAKKAELSLVVKPPAEQRMVTMKAENISVIDAIDRACAVADLSWRYTGVGIEVGLPEAFASK